MHFTFRFTVPASVIVWTILKRGKKRGGTFPCNLFTNTPATIIQLFQYCWSPVRFLEALKIPCILPPPSHLWEQKLCVAKGKLQKGTHHSVPDHSHQRLRQLYLFDFQQISFSNSKTRTDFPPNSCLIAEGIRVKGYSWRFKWAVRNDVSWSV